MSVWRVLWRLVRAHPRAYLVSATCWTVFLVGRLVPGLFERAFFDSLTGGASALSPWALVAIVVSLELARLVSSIGSTLADVTFQFASAALLRGNLLRTLLGRPAAAALTMAPGAAVSRFRDDVDSVARFTAVPITMLGTLGFAVVAVVVMLRIDVALTLVVIVPLLAVIALARVASQRVQRYRTESRSATASITTFLGELFGAVLTVRATGAEPRMVGRLEALNEQRRQATVRDALFEQLLQSIFVNTVDVGTGVILLLAAGPMLAGTFTIGDFALFSYYLFFVIRLPIGIGALLVQRRQADVAIERLLTLADGSDPGRLTAAAAPPGPARIRSAGRLDRLEVRGLSCRHPGSTRGVAGVDLVLERGSFTVVTGRVGSGKTTLLRALLGLLPGTAGTILWNGREVEDAAQFFVPPRCAYVPQVPRLCSDTIADNIRLGLPVDDARVADAVRLAALERDVDALTDGLDTLTGPRGTRLSGGQVARVAAARALVREPDLLVLDDLSSSLDVETERALWAGLASRPGVTLLVAAHRRQVLERAQHIVLLADGRVRAQGRLPALLAGCAEMRELFREQSSLDGGAGREAT